ncbi:MAG TPA: DcrB-related protein [Aggregatilineales bacterium]|nr:DcrB-related protein [Anaerolineales bacterium]HRE49048.1 DcrB-related protein [Aggregatilineales bacterium]
MATRTYMEFQGPLFTLKTPSDWFITASPEIQAMFIEPSHGQRLRANVIITLRPVQPDVTAEVVMKNAQETENAEYPGFTLLAEDDVQAGVGTGKYHMYSWLNPDGNVPVLQTQAFFVINQVLITMTATCDLDVQEDVAPVFNEMFSSFKIG